MGSEKPGGRGWGNNASVAGRPAAAVARSLVDIQREEVAEQAAQGSAGGGGQESRQPTAQQGAAGAWAASQPPPKSLLHIQNEEVAALRMMSEKEDEAKSARALVARKKESGWQGGSSVVMNSTPSASFASAPPAKSLRQIQDEQLRQSASSPQVQQQPGRPMMGVWGASSTSSTAVPKPTLAPVPATAPTAPTPSSHHTLAPSQTNEEVMFWDYGAPSSFTHGPPQPVVREPSSQQNAFPSIGGAPASRMPTSQAWAASQAGPRPAASAPPGSNYPSLSKPTSAKPLASPASTAQPVAQQQSKQPKSKMPKPVAEFRQWCGDQMRTLTGSNDMTLVDFLVSLPSPSEIQEYVNVYLGKTPQTSKFATELIKRKLALGGDQLALGGFQFVAGEDNKRVITPPVPSEPEVAAEWQPAGGENVEPEWEAGGKQKKKKTKKVDPSLLGFNISSASRNSGGLDFIET